MTQHHPPPSSPPGAPYETTDANIKQISIWTIGIFVTIFTGMALMAALLVGFFKFPIPLDRPPTAAEYERTLPPAPRLQVNQPGDLKQFREREDQLLGSYAREHNSGAVRIPIDKAIDIVAARGVLPGAPKQAAAVAAAKK